MTSSKSLNCLILLSGSDRGVSAPSFIQAFTLLHRDSGILCQLASPEGKQPEFVNVSDGDRRWLAETRAKSYSIPISVDTVDASRYSCLFVPHSPGACYDLANDAQLDQILDHFIKSKKPICAIGQGVAALFCAKSEDRKSWGFKGSCMTATSVFELASVQDFANLAVFPEDYIRDHGGKYTCSDVADNVHVCIDGHVITGQNEQSTLTAVQNLILMCNQRLGKTTASPR